MFVRNIGDGLNVNQRRIWIANRFNENKFGVVLDCRLENVRALSRVNKSRLDTEGGQRMLKKIKSKSWSPQRYDDLVGLRLAQRK